METYRKALICLSRADQSFLDRAKYLVPVRSWCQCPEKHSDHYQEKQRHQAHQRIYQTGKVYLKDRCSDKYQDQDKSEDGQN
jgi:hypothetical protein